MPRRRRSIRRAHLDFSRWWAIVRLARWLGVRWTDVAPHDRRTLEDRIARALGLD